MASSAEASPRPALELWGGIECTVNRVGNRYHDQLERTGHADRPDDLRKAAALGIRRLRYPVLWERVAPEHPDRPNWRWTDLRLGDLRSLGIAPIAGLVHHGSGPVYSTLLDPGFPAQLAAYARRVAERYPWIDAYTPINEPLTTARFCGLYGHWYPHARSDAAFVRALLHQCKATVLAMRAVRQVNPSAHLVQTDDAGKTFSTRALAYQARFENDRRWLAWDLLCGAVDRAHPLWRYLRSAGAASGELAWFLDNPCPPDIVGLNYYVTSDRFLDDRCHLYPGLLTRAQLDIADEGSVAAALQRFRPWAVVNAAGYVRVDDAESDELRCRRENTSGAERLAEACTRRGLRLLCFSSDLVFDGHARRPYRESDPVAPRSAYGRSKADAEIAVLANCADALIARTSAFFGPWDEANVVTRAGAALAAGQPWRAPTDQRVSPTYVPDLVNVSLDLLIDGADGVWHLANDGDVSWAELARKAASAMGYPEELIEDCLTDDLRLAAARPSYRVLGTEQGQRLPALDDALARFVAERERQRRQPSRGSAA